MSATLLLAQVTPDDTSSGAVIVFGMLVLIGVLSILALTSWGRRSLMPLVAIILGLVVLYTTVADAISVHTISILTVLGLLIGLTLVLGGFGALREGIALPPVEGVEPEIEPRSPRITPTDGASTESGAKAPEVN